MIKDMFFSCKRIQKTIIGYRTRCSEGCFQTAEATGECIGSKIGDKNVKSKCVVDENPRNAEEIIILPEKKRRNIEKKCCKNGTL